MSDDEALLGELIKKYGPEWIKARLPRPKRGRPPGRTEANSPMEFASCVEGWIEEAKDEGKPITVKTAIKLMKEDFGGNEPGDLIADESSLLDYYKKGKRQLRAARAIAAAMSSYKRRE